MRKLPQVTVIILNHNGIGQTRRCLTSILTTDYPNFKVLLVDNGSDLNEAEILQKAFTDKRIKFLRLTRNWGFAKGNNLILGEIKSHYVAFLNNDTKADADWLRELVKVAEADPKIAVCQPKIKSLKRKNFFEYAGAAGGFLDVLGYPFARGRIFFTIEEDRGQYDDGGDIFWASGTAMFVKRKVLDKVGFFDDNFFAYAEEVDLCWRIHKMGLRVVYVPKSCVYHVGGATSNRDLTKKIFLVHRNHLLLILKHYSLASFLMVLPLRVILDLASSFLYLLQGKPKLIFALVAAYLSLFFKMRGILAKRSKAVEKDNSYKKLIYKRSIVFDYFILGKKVFRDLNFPC